VAYPAADGTRAIDGCGIDWLEQLSARFATANPFAPQFRNVQMAIFSNVDQLNFDGEGRVLLTPKLIEHANITEQAAFVGLGDKFQIWRPEALEQARGNAMRQAVDEMATLDLPPAPPGDKR
jgi:MraZ protein